MINQIAPVQTKTTPLPAFNRTLIQARHIQARLKETAHKNDLPEAGYFWSPMTAGPVMVPVLSWLD